MGSAVPGLCYKDSLQPSCHISWQMLGSEPDPLRVVQFSACKTKLVVLALMGHSWPEEG